MIGKQVKYMSANNLLKYLQTVLQLQTKCRTLSMSLEKNTLLLNELTTEYVITKPENRKVSFRDYGYSIVAGVIGIGCTYWATNVLRNSGDAPDLLSWAVGLLGKVFVICVLLVGIAALLYCLFMLFDFYMTKRKAEKENEKQLEKYKWAVAHNEQQKVINRQQANELRKDCAILKQQYDETKALLDRYYSMNVLREMYHKLIPVSMFVQYIECGITTYLEGPGGCYALYREDLKHKKIVDEIRAFRNEFYEEMYVLRGCIENSNQKIDHLSAQTDLTNQHLAILEYNEQLNAENTKVLKDYTIYRDLLR